MSVTVCWAVKGGSGTSVVAAALALSSPTDTLLVDLDGELPAVLGIPEPAGQGLADWLASDAPATAVAGLAVDVTRTTRLVPRGSAPVDHGSERWPELAAWLAASAPSVVDAGTREPPDGLAGPGVRTLLVTRNCYLALRRAAQASRRPDGVVLVREHGRSLGRAEVEHAVGAPVVASLSIDPGVARAVDAGLGVARLPITLSRQLRGAA